MKIQIIPIEDIKPYFNNPRVNEEAVASVAESIKAFGFQNPMILDEDNVIIAGHTRYKASLLLGLLECPCIIADLPEDKAKAYRIADNKTSEKAFWDIDKLQLEITELKDMDIDLTSLGFETDELDELLNPTEDPGGDEDEDNVPVVKESICREGDIWQLGEHRLLCGDALNVENIKKLIGDDLCDLMFTSPPYNVGSNSIGGNKKMVKSKYINDDDRKAKSEYLGFLIETYKAYSPVTKYQVFNLQQLANNKVQVIEFLNELRNHFVDVSIWNKGGGQPAIAESVMNSRFEYVFIFSREDYPNRTIKNLKFRNISNVFDFCPSGKNLNTDIHAAVFPVEFVRHYLSYMCRVSVIDPFVGSGTTIIASEQLGISCYAMDLEPIYCDVAIRRWEEYTGNKAVKIG